MTACHITDYHTIIWYKTNAFSKSNDNFPKLINSFEIITLLFVSGRKGAVFNYPDNPKLRRNVWPFQIASKNQIVIDQFSKNPINSAQKPLMLLQYLIHRHSNPGSWILDLCSGTGTALLAAMTTGRNCTAVELSIQSCVNIDARVAAFNFNENTVEIEDIEDILLDSDDEKKAEEPKSPIHKTNLCSSCSSELLSNSGSFCMFSCGATVCSNCANNGFDCTKCNNYNIPLRESDSDHSISSDLEETKTNPSTPIDDSVISLSDNEIVHPELQSPTPENVDHDQISKDP